MLKKISFYFTTLFLAFSLIGSAYAVTLKASHQWPGTPRADGSYDPRHEMVQIIADEVKKAGVDLDIRIYPAKSLYKPKEQWKPMTTGQLDISAFPLAYASKFHPEFDATLMPGTVKNHDHALRFNKGPMMTEIKRIITDAGVVTLGMTINPQQGDKVLVYEDYYYVEESAADLDYYEADNVAIPGQAIYTFPVNQRNTNVEIRVYSNMPYPLSLSSMVWEGQYSPRFIRRA